MKALVLFSGGLDSTTCLAMAVNEYKSENVIALSLFYGQKHKKEIKAAYDVCRYYNVNLIEMDLSVIFKGSNCTLLEGNADISFGTYKMQQENKMDSPVDTYVPFRNGLFLSVAASVALSHDCNVIYYGIHADDQAYNAYPDTSNEFNDSISKAIYTGSGKAISVIAPFVGLNKSDVVKKGLELKAPYQLTWSCYLGKEKACGKCATCLDRKEAFRLNNVKDFIEYEE